MGGLAQCRSIDAAQHTPEFAQISRLAYLDEGAVHFEPQEPHEECTRLMSSVDDGGAQEIIRNLLDASDSALRDEDADVIVHPFPP